VLKPGEGAIGVREIGRARPKLEAFEPRLFEVDDPRLLERGQEFRLQALVGEDVDLFNKRDGHGLNGASIEHRRQPALRFFNGPVHERRGLGPYSGDLLTRPLSNLFSVAQGLFDQRPGQNFGISPGPLEEIVPDLSGFFMGGLNEPWAFGLLGLPDHDGGPVFGLLDLQKGPGGSILDGLIILVHIST